MTSRWRIQGVALTLCVGLLLGLCGCKSNTKEQAGTTAGTTSTVANDGGTTATTTTTAPVEDAMQIGGSTFTLDGETFEMGVSPEKLLAYLGEPNKVESWEDPIFDAMDTDYFYDDLILVTLTPAGTTDEIIRQLYFTSDRYSFDGITVGDTVETLDQKVTIPLKESFRCGAYHMGILGGACYWYDVNEEDQVSWAMFFPEELQEVTIANGAAPSGTEITFILIKYML